MRRNNGTHSGYRTDHVEWYGAPNRRRYGLFKFLFDCFMIVITGGLWLIWIFVREMRR